jgi:hypothetical protein
MAPGSVTFLLLVSGGESLRVLAVGDPMRGTPFLVIGTLAAAAFLLGLISIAGPQDRSSKTAAKETPKAAGAP